MSELKRFFEANGGRKVSSAELLAFKAACSPEEYDSYVAQAKQANMYPVAVNA